MTVSIHCIAVFLCWSGTPSFILSKLLQALEGCRYLGVDNIPGMKETPRLPTTPTNLYTCTASLHLPLHPKGTGILSSSSSGLATLQTRPFVGSPCGAKVTMSSQIYLCCTCTLQLRLTPSFVVSLKLLSPPELLQGPLQNITSDEVATRGWTSARIVLFLLSGVCAAVREQTLVMYSLSAENQHRLEQTARLPFVSLLFLSPLLSHLTTSFHLIRNAG